MSVSTYRQDIDGLRAIAVLSVVAHHMSKDFCPSGFLGVDVFFVISGFVITKSLLSRGMHAPAASLKMALLQFYARRVRRLLPALGVCILGTFFIASLLVPSDSTYFIRSWRTGVAAFGMSNMYLLRQATDYFGGDAELNGLLKPGHSGSKNNSTLFSPSWFLGRCVHSRTCPAYRVHRRLMYATALMSFLSLASYLVLAYREQVALIFWSHQTLGAGRGVLLGALVGR